jgi:hypothetical protein
MKGPCPKAALGYAETVDVYGTSTVIETLTCAHCGAIYEKPAPGAPYGFCTLCFKPTCLRCGGSLRCDPFEKKLERIERRSKLLGTSNL